MNEEAKEKGGGLKRVWCNTWIFAANMGRRAQILGRYTLACWQQSRLKGAICRLGQETFKALERGETNPLAMPEVNAVLQKAKEYKELKEKNYQAIAAIRERIKGSCVIATPEEPGGIEVNPPVP